MKLRLLLCLLLCMLISCTACLAESEIANPWTECSSLSEAESVAGFDINVPGSYSGASAAFSAIEDNMIQVTYTYGSNQLVIRKGIGAGDISGDYNSYATTYEATFNGVDMVFKGNGSRPSLVTWSYGAYTYSMDSTSGMSLSFIGKAIRTLCS